MYLCSSDPVRECATNPCILARAHPGLAELGKISALCNEATLAWVINKKDGKGGFAKTGAPTEAALKVLAEKIGVPDRKENDFIFANKDNVRGCFCF